MELDECNQNLARLQTTILEETSHLLEEKITDHSREDLRILQETDQLVNA